MARIEIGHELVVAGLPECERTAAGYQMTRFAGLAGASSLQRMEGDPVSPGGRSQVGTDVVP